MLSLCIIIMCALVVLRLSLLSPLCFCFVCGCHVSCICSAFFSVLFLLLLFFFLLLLLLHCCWFFVVVFTLRFSCYRITYLPSLQFFPKEDNLLCPPCSINDNKRIQMNLMLSQPKCEDPRIAHIEDPLHTQITISLTFKFMKTF